MLPFVLTYKSGAPCACVVMCVFGSGRNPGVVPSCLSTPSWKHQKATADTAHLHVNCPWLCCAQVQQLRGQEAELKAQIRELGQQQKQLEEQLKVAAAAAAGTAEGGTSSDPASGNAGVVAQLQAQLQDVKQQKAAVQKIWRPIHTQLALTPFAFDKK